MEKIIVISIEYFDALKILKPRELEVLEEVAKGRTSREIAQELYLAPGTVKNYRQSVCQKLELNGYRALFNWCEKYLNVEYGDK